MTKDQHRLVLFKSSFRVIVCLLVAACGSTSESLVPESFPQAAEGVASSENIQTGSVSDRQSYAQGSEVRFEWISVEQGLSQSTVLSILQDSTGFMWFGTNAGLYRYDGKEFKVYRHEPQDALSLSQDVITALVEDNDGNLWIGTDGGGINKYDRRTETFTHFTQSPDDSASLGNDSVAALHIDHSGALWVGTGGGLDRLDPMTGAFIHYQIAPGDPLGQGSARVESLHLDGDGFLWIGTNGVGVSSFDIQTERFTHFLHDPDDPHSLVSNYLIEAIYEDHRGEVWIGTLEGLDRYDRQTGEFLHYQNDPDDPASLSNNTVTSILEDRAGIVWIGTMGGGLNRFDPESGQFFNYQNVPRDTNSLSNNVVVSIYQDQVGAIWIGTVGGGINRIDPVTKDYEHFQYDPDSPDGLSNNLVWAIHEDRNGVLWIGTNGSGLDRFDRTTNSWRNYRNDPDNPHSLSNNNVSSIIEDQDGELWIGTLGGGVDRFDPQTEQFIHYPYEPDNPQSLGNPFVYAILEDQEGMIWIATDEGANGGLHQLDPQTERFTHFKHERGDLNSVTDNWVRALFEDRAGVLWVGTRNFGLNRYDRSTGIFDHYQHESNDPASISDNTITFIVEDQEGVLWVGTGDGGLNKMEREQGTFTHYTIDDGLPSNVIYGVLEEVDSMDAGGNLLWISTSNGLSKFDPRTETFTNYDASDGLQSNQFIVRSCYQNDRGEMFFGGVNGFNAFYPDRIMQNPYVPPVMLTSLQQNGERVELDIAVESLKEITFQWPNNSFEFEFAALNFLQPEKNLYAYMLEGFDQDWNYTGNRNYGRYTNLPGGSYTLRMKASNNDEIWNEQGTSVTVHIMSPFWETWWFRGVILLVLAGGVVLGYQLRVRNVEARSRELEKQVEARTAELQREIEQRTQMEAALRERERDKAVADERSRLARELHDAVTQTLFSASLIAEVLPQLWDSDQEAGYQQLEEIRLLTRGALAEMRALLFELRPETLSKAKMKDLLRQLGRATTGRTGTPVEVTTAGDCTLPSTVQIAFYHIAQEALNNATQHAEASHLHVSLVCEPGSARLSIGDDGRGFEPSTIPAGHFGLQIMRERAMEAGVELIIESQPGQGTMITVLWVEAEEERRSA